MSFPCLRRLRLLNKNDMFIKLIKIKKISRFEKTIKIINTVLSIIKFLAQIIWLKGQNFD